MRARALQPLALFSSHFCKLYHFSISFSHIYPHLCFALDLCLLSTFLFKFPLSFLVCLLVCASKRAHLNNNPWVLPWSKLWPLYLKILDSNSFKCFTPVALVIKCTCRKVSCQPDFSPYKWIDHFVWLPSVLKSDNFTRIFPMLTSLD